MKIFLFCFRPILMEHISKIFKMKSLFIDLFLSTFSPVIEPDSVEVNSVSSTVNLCDSTNNNQVLVTCQVSIDDVSPAPTFSFSLAGLAFETPVPGTNTGSHYQRQFDLNPTVGGEYQVTCRVTNTVLPNTRQESQTTVIFRRKLSVQFCSEVMTVTLCVDVCTMLNTDLCQPNKY